MTEDYFTGLETARVRLRPFQTSDLEAFIAYRNDPEVARYQSWEGISQEKAAAFVQEQANLQPGIPGQWFQIAIELKTNGTLIGDCAFQRDAEDSRLAEIGFTLSRAYQKQGLAFEAVSAWLDFAFQRFELHRVTAITDCENTSSFALLERLGMRREGHFLQNIWFKGKWGDEFLYAILQDEWQAIHPISPTRSL